ncbi:MAG: carboxypeptidase regulatory-like domain-containing protein, partial [Caldilineaceae bacterium]|nr:carboxypeptidase regulatory-like domain-containing protein [Caldilineaceae bacterium]
MICLLLLTASILSAKVARADGTETLGTPSISIAGGTGIVASGTGMVAQPGVINITVPDGATVTQVLLYWEGQMRTDTAGDNTIRVNGTTIVTGSLIGGQSYFFNRAYSSVFRADITTLNLIQAGANTITLDQLTFTKVANGAGIMVIYDDGTTPAEIDLRDGVDLAYFNFPAPRRDTVPQTVAFPASSVARTAEIVVFASSVEGAVSGQDDRPDSIEVTVDGITTIFTNPLNSNDGDEWDTVNLQVDIPAGATTMTIQLFSRDDLETGLTPASMTWIASGFAIIPPLAAIDIEKATNGEDADQPTGPQIFVGDPVVWSYVVTNIGEVDLNNVTVTDDQIGTINCPQRTLAVAASMTCTATGTAIVGQYANTATVVGTPVSGGADVTDEDPSHYIGIRPAAVGDKVFRDSNDNGLQDPGEPGVNGVTVELRRSNNALVAVMLTNNGGEYFFDQLLPGDYYVTFVNTTGNGSCTAANVGDDDASDSDGVVSPTDPTGNTCMTAIFNLEEGETDRIWDLGLVYPTASILLEKATNGEDADLPTGPQIRVGDPVVWSYDVTNSGTITLTDIRLSDDILGPVTCPQTILGPGLSMICTATGTASEGQYANIGTVTGTPIDESGIVTDTDPSHYFGYLPAAVGDIVFGDINPDGVTPQDIGSGNGIQDDVPQEQGIPGIIVKLYASDDTLISTTVTAEDGTYLFDNLPPGDYYIVFVNPGIGIWTLPDVGDDDSADSDGRTPVEDPDGSALRTEIFTLSSGETDLTWDAGLIGLSGSASAAAGNRVWVDSNSNGLQDE